MDVNKIKEKREEIQQRSGGQFVSELKYALQVGDNILRLVGDPESMFRAWVMCDDGVKRPFHIPKDSILQELVDLVLSYTSIQEDDGTWRRKYHHQDSPSFDLIFRNRSDDVRDRGWRASEVFLFNCIPRMQSKDLDGKLAFVAKEKEHTLLLTKSASAIGIGRKAFESFALMVENWGDPENYDVNLMKSGRGIDTLYSCDVAPKSNPRFSQFVVEGPLTEKEKSYERYDLLSLTTPTSSLTVLKNLEKTITRIDTEFNSHFVEKLHEDVQVKGEKEEEPQEQTREKVKEAVKKGSRRGTVKEEETDINMEPCAKCGKPFPVTDTACPYCGAEYEMEEE